MTADEVLISTTKTLERDLWRDLATSPPDHMLVKDICSLAAQLLITRESIKRFGNYIPDAAEFIAQADNLALKIEQIGGERRIRDSLLFVQLVIIADFADVLLDMICTCRS